MFALQTAWWLVQNWFTYGQAQARAGLVSIARGHGSLRRGN